LKVNSNDTEVSGAFGTWTGKWEQEDFKGVKVGADKTVAIDYTIPSNAGATIKAMVFWPHGNGVTIQKVVLHKDGSSVETTTTKKTTTTTRTTTTTTRATTTTTKEQPKEVSIYGDANNDSKLDMSDVVIIMQALANPNKYGLNGSDPNHISQQGWANADVHKNGNGVTMNDALAIQMKLLGLITSLPTNANLD
ncbi:MAG: dockerin type I repeat-containing protein, partial [Ruminococcus sp.]|uniref:dockerin type I repeat-containing protein n=1 Tax=Ruminococcus sp. TaxID=41978 RepID=UPI0025EAA968